MIGVIWWSNTVVISLVTLGLLLPPLGCLSFQVIIQPPHHNILTTTSKIISSRIIFCSTKSSSADLTTGYYSPYNLEEYNNESSSSSSSSSSNDCNGVEIWLDLRGTSLSPSTALELWALEHPSDNVNTNDDNVHNNKSTTTVPIFTKCLVSPPSNSNISNSDKHLQQKHDNIHVLVADDDNDEASSSSSSSSSSWGKILPLETSTQSYIPLLPDPLPAMEIISDGKWIVLDTTTGWKGVEEEKRLSFLLPLAELISSGAVTNVGGGGSRSTNGGGGGIGFTCQTRNEVVKVAMWIQSITNRCNDGNAGSGGKNVRVKTLENGLVIPDESDDVSFDELQKQQQFGTSRQARLQYAIVVPYDVGLLKTAAMLLLNEGF
jgi:hypothetical protein